MILSKEESNMKHSTITKPATGRLARLLLLIVAAGLLSVAATAQYTSSYANPPAAAADVTGIENSGWTEYILWATDVDSSGDLTIATPPVGFVTNGTYVGNTAYPNLVSQLATIKQGTVKRITVGLDSNSFPNIEALVNSTNTSSIQGPVGGTGTTSALYKTFAALKAALPVDAIDFDDEGTYDSASSTQFAVMLAGLGYHVTIAPYTNTSYWTSLVSAINAQAPGAVDLVHLQAYSGGEGNSPCSGWNFGSVPVIAGEIDSETPAQFQAQFQTWHTQCGTAGGFLYQNHNGANGEAVYASAIDAGVGISVSAGVYGIGGVYTDGTQFAVSGVGGRFTLPNGNTAGTGSGLDGDGNAYSSNLLGTSLTWNDSTFTFGPANSPNVWNNTTIALPSGQYGALNLLATGVNGSQTAQPFTVKYTDGTSTIATQSLSDWTSPQNYPGESQVLTMNYRDTVAGGQTNGTTYLYGYSLPIDNSKTVKSVQLPLNVNVVVLAYALAASPTITITPATLPAATAGTAYSATLTASSGTAPYTFALSGTLPAGITLTAGGVLAGTPTASGTFNFTVTATDSSPTPLTGTATYTLTVNAAAVTPPTITITPATLPAATAGTAYSATLTASGGAAPYTFALSGTLPNGITLTPGGALAGTPTASGTFNFTVTATDSSPNPGPYMGAAMYALTVNAAPPTTFTFTTSGASTSTVAAGAAATYSFSLAPASGESYPGTVSFTVTGLPAGATASFSPSTVAASAAASTLTMTVQTAAAMAQNHIGPIGRGFVLALLLLPFGMKRSLRKKLSARMLLLLLLLAATTTAMSGCGGSKNSSNGSSTMQSAQTYMLTVTATSGAVTQSQAVTLIVQ